MLSTISEKDSVIADLECDRSASNKSRVQRLMDEKDNLHQQLKDLVCFLFLNNKKDFIDFLYCKEKC